VTMFDSITSVDQQPRRIAGLDGNLSDVSFGKLVVEVAELHRPYRSKSRRSPDGTGISRCW
jgi:hypothetical protein